MTQRFGLVGDGSSCSLASLSGASSYWFVRRQVSVPSCCATLRAAVRRPSAFVLARLHSPRLLRLECPRRASRPATPGRWSTGVSRHPVCSRPHPRLRVSLPRLFSTCPSVLRSLFPSVAGPSGPVESRPELDTEFVMDTRACPWNPIGNKAICPRSAYSAPNSTPVSRRRETPCARMCEQMCRPLRDVVASRESPWRSTSRTRTACVFNASGRSPRRSRSNASDPPAAQGIEPPTNLGRFTLCHQSCLDEDRRAPMGLPRGRVVAHGIESCGRQLPDALGQWRAYNCAGRGRRASSIATSLARPCGPAAGMGLGGTARPPRGAERHDDSR